MHGIIKLVASDAIVLPVLALIILFFKTASKQWLRLAEFVLLGAVISFVLAKIGSHLYYDPRPFVGGHVKALIAHSNDNGFPSDHTLLSSVIAFVVMRYSRKFGIALLVVAALIGIARIAAHVHHPADIIGSVCFAAAGVGVAYFITERSLKKDELNA